MLRIGMLFTILLTLVPAKQGIAADTVIGPHCNLEVFGEKDKQEFLAFDKTFRTALKEGDAGTLASVVEFPLRLNYGPGVSVSVDTPATLQAKFEMAFPPEIRNAVLSEDPTQIRCGYDGIMYGNGAVWADKIGETAASTRYLVVAINLPKKTADETSSRKGRVDYVCNTTRHHVVVDEPNGTKPRYRAWNNPHTVAEKPDMQIDEGLDQFEGTGQCGHDVWIFKKGGAEFDVSALGCYGDDPQPPAGAKGQLQTLMNGALKQQEWCF